MRTWELFRQALAGVARARLRSTLTALGVAIGCGALVSMMAFALGLQHELESPLKKLGLLNEIQVWARSPDDDAPRRRGRRREGSAESQRSADKGAANKPAAHPPLDDKALAGFRAIPGVKYAYPNISVHGAGVRLGTAKSDAYVVALPREAAMGQVLAQLITAGRFFGPGDAREALLAKGLLEELELKSAKAALGKEVEISSAGLKATEEEDRFEFRRAALRVRIVGVFDSPDLGPFGTQFGRRSIVMPADLVAQLPGQVENRLWQLRRGDEDALRSFQGVTVRAENPGVVRGIAQTIEDRGFETQTVLDELDDMRTAFLFIESLLTAVGSVALVIASLGIANTLLMTVLERYEEIGLYKAIGATDGDVRLLFMAEAAVLGLAGSLAGLLLAAGVCWALQWGISAFLASEGIDRPVDVFYFPWWLLAGGVAVCTLLSITSGLYPASRAARVDPIQALRRA